jgi:hypothetical protein
MENIHEPTDAFPFDQLQFISPTAVPGGNYFIRCLTGTQKPVYIQPPKCSSKAGIVKTGKRMYIDLVFQHDDEQFIEWVEKLENLCQMKIFDNRAKWFESGLEMHDIENSFTPAMKIYKSGKMYILRANIPIRLGKCGLKIYDEQEQDVVPDTIDDTRQLMTILEIQGIKCSARNFQLEVEVKQMMTLNPVDLFESCVFAKKTNVVPAAIQVPSAPVEEPESIAEPTEETHETETTEKTEETTPILDDQEDQKVNTLENPEVIEEIEPLETPNAPTPIIKIDTQTKEDVGQLVELEELEEIEELGESKDGLCEIDFPLDNSSEEVMQLKPRTDVYFEMYQNAKRKAKVARDIALNAYLEAKQIKSTYLLDEDLEEDDDEDLEKNEEEVKSMEKDIEASFTT